MKHAVIKIILVGTEEQLDHPEGEFAVKHLDDQALRAACEIWEMEGKYPNFGWTILIADKILSEGEIVKELTDEQK